jgi:hypothetical protein
MFNTSFGHSQSTVGRWAAQTPPPTSTLDVRPTHRVPWFLHLTATVDFGGSGLPIVRRYFANGTPLDGATTPHWASKGVAKTGFVNMMVSTLRKMSRDSLGTPVLDVALASRAKEVVSLGSETGHLAYALHVLYKVGQCFGTAREQRTVQERVWQMFDRA